MARFELLGTAIIPGKGTQLRLLQRNDEFSIKIAGSTGELMNSRLHGSEDALATLACERISEHPAPRVLIGGLGMGFTLALVLLAGLREESELSDIPALIKGTAMNLIIAGILSLAFMGFAGLAD